MATCGEVLVKLLEAYGVEQVFGIPGVHTVELYRGLASSPINHVTRVMSRAQALVADGYAHQRQAGGVFHHHRAGHDQHHHGDGQPTPTRSRCW